MRFRNASLIVVLLTATVTLAQETSPASAPAATPLRSQNPLFAGRRGMSSRVGKNAADMQAPATLREQMQDMEGTLVKMHALLKQMLAKGAANSKDPVAKANLEMWGLMVGHLDKQLEELQQAVAKREDFEARRAAMYKQADAKADAVAQAARAAQAAHAAEAPESSNAGQTPPAPVPAGSAAGQGKTGETPAEQTPPAHADSPNSRK